MADSRDKDMRRWREECLALVLGHATISRERMPDGLDIASYKAGFEDGFFCADHSMVDKASRYLRKIVDTPALELDDNQIIKNFKKEMLGEDDTRTSKTDSID
jgi:hypothetical protein